MTLTVRMIEAVADKCPQDATVQVEVNGQSFPVTRARRHLPNDLVLDLGPEVILSPAAYSDGDPRANAGYLLGLTSARGLLACFENAKTDLDQATVRTLRLCVDAMIESARSRLYPPPVDNQTNRTRPTHSIRPTRS